MLADEGQAVGEAEVAEARAGVVARVLGGRVVLGVVDGEEAAKECAKGDGHMTFTTPDDGALEGKLEVRRGREAEHRGVYPGGVGVHVALEGADEEVIA